MSKETRHQCKGTLPSAGYGESIAYCGESLDGTLWVSNDEYCSQVAFCPYCGLKAKVGPSVIAADTPAATEVDNDPKPLDKMAAGLNDAIAIARDDSPETPSKPREDGFYWVRDYFYDSNKWVVAQFHNDDDCGWWALPYGDSDSVRDDDSYLAEIDERRIVRSEP